MPTLREYRGRGSVDPGSQLASDLGASALALLEFLVERGDKDLQTRILEQNLELSRQSSDLNRQSLERGQVDLQRALEELSAVKGERKLKGVQEAIEPRVSERQTADLTMAQRTRQAREAMEGVWDEAVVLERDGIIYAPARDYAFEHGSEADPAPKKREARTKFLSRYMADVEEHARQVRDLARSQQAEMRKIDPESAREDAAIDDEVNRTVKRAFNDVVKGDLESETDALEMLIFEAQNSTDSPLSGVATEAMADPEIRASYEERAGEIVREREIAMGGGLESLLGKKYGVDLEGKIDQPGERKVLEAIEKGSLPEEDASLAMQMLAGNVRYDVGSGPDGDSAEGSYAYSEDKTTGQRTVLRAFQDAPSGGTRDDELESLFGGPGDYREKQELMRMLRSTAPPKPASQRDSGAGIEGPLDFMRTGLRGIGGMLEEGKRGREALRGGGDPAQGNASQSAAFEAGLTAGMQAALQSLMGAPAGPSAQGAPAPIPGVTPEQNALPSGVMGPAMQGLGAARGAMSMPSMAMPGAQQQGMTPEQMMLLPLLLGSGLRIQ